MTLFAVWATDHDAALAARERVRPLHRARLRDPAPHKVKVVLAGPTLERQEGGMNGTLLLVEADDLDAVRDFVRGDPYVEAGVYRSFEIRPFVCGLGSLVPPTPKTAP